VVALHIGAAVVVCSTQKACQTNVHTALASHA